MIRGSPVGKNRNFNSMKAAKRTSRFQICKIIQTSKSSSLPQGLEALTRMQVTDHAITHRKA